MFIKKIKISNFKSYGEEIVLDNLSPASNILVGANGAGKSNFLEAIKFVIDFGKSYLQQTEKIKLYHHGRKCLLSVEILIVDCDKLLDEREISLKRTLNGAGSKVYINGQVVLQEEFQKFLELWGFCIRKPYYIADVKSVNNFIGITPNERLNFIISNLGTNISVTFIAMREIANLLEDVKYRFDMINDIISDLDRVDSNLLHQEVIKLDKYRELNEKKNSLLMLLHLKFILKWKANISELQRLLENTNEYATKSYHINDAIAGLKIPLNEVKEIIVNYSLIKEDILKELNILLVKKERITLSIAEVNKNIDLIKNKINDENDDDLNKEIQLIVLHLFELEDRYKIEKCKLKKVEEQLSSASQTRLDLISKTTRKFNSEEERNLWIQNQLSIIQVQIQENDDKLSRLLRQKNALINKRFELETSLLELDDSHSSDTIANKKAEAKLEYTSLLNELNDFRLAQCDTEYSIKMIKSNLDIMKGKLRAKLGRATFDGCESVDKVRTKWKNSDDEEHHNLLKGYHGLVIDNFKCNEQLNVALETAAGNRLFQHIVDNSSVGTAILKEMNLMQLPGETWFLPLDKIKESTLQYPQDTNVIPLINEIKFHNKFEKIMKFVFGNILICNDLETAVQAARLYRFTCITLEGDKVYNKGPLSGGFIEQKGSLRSLYLKICAMVEQSNLLNINLEKYKETLRVIQLKLDQLHSAIQQYKTDNIVYSKQSETNLKIKIANINNEIDIIEKDMETIGLNNLKLKIRQTSLSNERNQKFGTSISKDELQLVQMNKLIDECEKKINILNNNLLKLDFEKKKLNDDLTYKNKIRRLKSAEYNDLKSYETKRNDLFTKEKLLADRWHALNEKLTLTDQKINKAKEENVKKNYDLEKLKQIKFEMQIDEQFIQKEKLIEKIGYFHIKIKESEKYIQSLYAKKYSKLILTRFEDESTHMLGEELKVTNAAIKSLGQVYVFARRTYMEAKKFRKECKRIEKQYSDFTIGCVTLMSFINWLETHIEHKIKNVSERYSYFFNKLVPNGSSSLIFYNNNTEGSETQELIAFGKNYGLGLCIRFSGNREELGGNTLSKGEQTIVLISIIFALLKTQEFPFCLFDEIDQHLSNEQLLLFIRILGSMSNIQFFISSHHENMIRFGHRIWHTTYESSKSNIIAIEFMNAQEILEKNKFREVSISISNGSSVTLSDSY